MRPNLRVAKSLVQFGAHLKAARLKRNLTQQLVAERAGISEATLKKIEAGSAGVSVGNCAAVLFALGFDVPFAELASPHKDSLGQSLADMEMRKRARPNSTLHDS